MRNPRRGVTLFETVVVLAVLVVSAGIAVPTLRSLAGSTPLNAAADAVKSSWQQARARAVAEGRPYRFAVKEGTGTYRVAPDGPDYWDGETGGSPVSTSTADGTRPPLVLQSKLPGNILFRTGSSSSPGQGQGGSGQGGADQGQSGDWNSPIVFLPDGTTQQDASISFGEAHGAPLVLQVQSVTGAATTSR